MTAENLSSQENISKYIKVENHYFKLQYFNTTLFNCIFAFYRMNTALVSKGCFLKKTFRNLADTKLVNSSIKDDEKVCA